MAETSPARNRHPHFQPVPTSRDVVANSSRSSAPVLHQRRGLVRLLAIMSLLLAAGFAIFQLISFVTHGHALSVHTKSPVVLEIAILVFREGLECMLVLAAITAGMAGGRESPRRPIAWGAGAGFIATLATWAFAVRVIDDLSVSISALAVQAATGESAKAQGLIDTAKKLVADGKWQEVGATLAQLKDTKLTSDQESALLELKKKLETMLQESLGKKPVDAGGLLPK